MTILQKLNIGEYSESLAVVDILKSGLYGGGIDLGLPRKLYCISKNVAWLYNLNSADPSLTATSNYLISLCGKYYLSANAIINSGNGGNISPIVPDTGTIYPFKITSSDFQSDGVSYNNKNIVGDNITLFINEYSNQFIYSGAGTFSYTATGIIMNIPGFNANVNTWTILIDKLNS